MGQAEKPFVIITNSFQIAAAVKGIIMKIDNRPAIDIKTAHHTNWLLVYPEKGKREQYQTNDTENIKYTTGELVVVIFI